MLLTGFLTKVPLPSIFVLIGSLRFAGSRSCQRKNNQMDDAQSPSGLGQENLQLLWSVIAAGGNMNGAQQFMQNTSGSGNGNGSGSGIGSPIGNILQVSLYNQ